MGTRHVPAVWSVAVVHGLRGFATRASPQLHCKPAPTKSGKSCTTEFGRLTASHEFRGIARVSSTTTERYFHLYAIARAAWNNLIEFAMLAPSEQARQEGANVASSRMKGLSALQVQWREMHRVRISALTPG